MFDSVSSLRHQTENKMNKTEIYIKNEFVNVV